MSDLYIRPSALQVGDQIFLDVTLQDLRPGSCIHTRRTPFAVFQIDHERGTARAYSGYVAYARCGRTGTKKWRSDICAYWHHGSWCIDRTYYRLNRNTGVVHSWNDVDPTVRPWVLDLPSVVARQVAAGQTAAAGLIEQPEKILVNQ